MGKFFLAASAIAGLAILDYSVYGPNGNTRQAVGAVTAKVQGNGRVLALISLAVCIVTRLLSGRPESGQKGTWSAATPGYWLPYLGHLPQMVWDVDGFLCRLRDHYPKGVFSLWLMGQTHTIVHKPQLSTQLMNKPHSVANEEWISEHLMVSNFGYRESDKPAFWNIFSEIHGLYSYLLAEEPLRKLVNTTAQTLKTSIADFVTFNSSPADQTDWERLANTDVVQNSSGETCVEADLMELTKNFVGSTANPSLMGTDFANNFPDFPSLIWDFDAAFVMMAMKLPFWTPYPPFQRARAAKHKILTYLDEFHEALEKHLNGEEPNLKWQDLENVSELIIERVKLARKHDIPVRMRSANDCGLTWAMNANSSPLVGWMVFEIFRDPILLEQIREEILPYVEAVQPKNEFGLGVWMPPRLTKLDVDGLVNHCPLLKSAYVETLRLYTGVWSIKWLEQDTTLGGRSDDAYLLTKGTYAHATQEVHQLDPTYFPNPHEWHGARHVKESAGEDGKIVRKSDLGTIRPYGMLTCSVFP